MRTTLDIDDPVLKELKRLQKAEGKSLGTMASELLAQAIAERRRPRPPAPFHWLSRPMEAKVDIGDKDALHRAMDRER